MSDIYSAPQSELTETSQGSQFGSLEKGINGDYELVFSDVLKEAWENTKGSKGTIWIALLLATVINMVVSFGSQFLVGIAAGATGSVVLPAVLSQLVVMLLTTPITAGLMIIGIRRAAQLKIRSSSVLDYFGKMLPLFICIVLMYLMVLLGFVLLIIPGIYLLFSYMFAIPLVVEKGLGPWEALEASRKAVTKSWFMVFGILFVTWLLIAISALPLLIGLIWTLPWGFIVTGTVYRNIFGVEQATVDSE